ncbi:hypothetical protein [Alcaligenes sp. SDU_A2]|uniref:hypothetical protein n=1 Tax=Alcaligenes sp. SDU_A2 TaxID=3136634 RepID=UPI00311E9923
MELFHTSPTEINKVTTLGRFGEFLFFSDNEYVMTAGEHITYRIELDKSQIVEAGQLFYHEGADRLAPLVAELAARLGVDEDEAEALIEESKSVYDLDGVEPEDAADLSWDVQLYTARAAKALGFRGVQVEDEQGTAFMVGMLGREAELERV